MSRPGIHFPYCNYQILGSKSNWVSQAPFVVRGETHFQGAILPVPPCADTKDVFKIYISRRDYVPSHLSLLPHEGAQSGSSEQDAWTSDDSSSKRLTSSWTLEEIHPPLWTVNIPDNITVLSAVINASQMAILSSYCVACLFPKAGAIFPISTKNIFNFQIKIYKDSKTGGKAWTQTANEQNCSWQSTAEGRELIMQYQDHKSISDSLDIKKQYSSSCCVD